MRNKLISAVKLELLGGKIEEFYPAFDSAVKHIMMRVSASDIIYA